MGRLKEINLEQGMPLADAAVRRLTFELHHAKGLGYSALKLIHGYGSSGTGGRIRVEARAYLGRLKCRGEIRDFIPGEAFSIFSEQTREAFSLCEELRRDRDLERHNNGVTFLLL